MNADRLLRIYQTYSLEKLNALNKKGLSLQYAQCEQLVKLRQEIASNNSETNKILRNQIKELERQEKVRYYKNLIFNIKRIVEKIESAQTTNLRLFFSSLFLSPISAFANESMQNLEDITDKEYAHSVLGKINALKSLNDQESSQYKSTCWSNYIEAKEAADDRSHIKSIRQKEHEINRLKREEDKTRDMYKTKRKISYGCLGCSTLITGYLLAVLIYSFIIDDPNKSGGVLVVFVAMIITSVCFTWYKKQKNERTCIENRVVEEDTFDKIACLQREIEMLKMQRERIETDYTNIVDSMNKECTNWQVQVNEILQLLPNDPDTDDILDPLLQDAALCVVNAQCGSTALIQRKFNIGYNRATRIMEQMEEIGIVGSASSNSREVLCDSTDKLKVLLKEYL